MRPKEVRPEDVAAAMNLSLAKAWRFAKQIESCYKPRRMQCVGGKHRPIDPLYKGPKKLLRRLHRWLQRQRFAHPRAHGGVRGRSCFTSARCHVGKPLVWTRDASKCYPSVTPDALIRELWALGFRQDTAKLLTLLFTVRGQIPQGSPVSCDALNLFFWRLDQTISSTAGSFALQYSRVADDFVVSGIFAAAGLAAVARIEDELASRGIAVNQEKKRKSGLQNASCDRLVHGISVSRRRGTAVNREQAKQALSLGESYLSSCKSVNAESLCALADKRARLVGWMHYCRQAEFSPAVELRRLLDAGDRRVHRKLVLLGITAYKNKWWLTNRKRNEPRRLSAIWNQRKMGQKGQLTRMPRIRLFSPT